MADEELTQEEIERRQELIEVMIEQARTGKKGIDADIARYLQETKTGKAIGETGKAAKTLTGGFKNSAKALGTSTGSFGDLTGAVTGTIGAITGLLSSIPVVGGAFKALGDAASETAEFAIGQVQANYDSFKELAKAGTIGADGVSGMADQFMKAGLPLQTYTKLLSKNSEQLAYFSGSALQGGKDFAKLMGNMDEQTKTYMRNLGYGVDEIAESAIEWQVLQRQRGIRQQLTDAELTKGTANYVSELDALAKLTGQNVDVLKKQRDEVRRDDRFRAQLMRLNADKNYEGARAMELFAATMMTADEEVGQGFKDITSGAINTEAAQKLFRSGMGDTMRSVQQGLESGKMSQSDALKATVAAAKESSKVGSAMHGLAGFIENGTGPFLSLSKTVNLGNMKVAEMTELIAKQIEVRKKPDPTTDKLSKTMAEMEQSIATVNQFFIATPAATDTIKLFSGALHKTIKFINKAFTEEKSKLKPKLTVAENTNAPTWVERKKVEKFGTDEEKAAMAKKLATTGAANKKAWAAVQHKQAEQRAGRGYQSPLSRWWNSDENESGAPVQLATAKSKPVTPRSETIAKLENDYKAKFDKNSAFNTSAEKDGWTTQETNTRKENERLLDMISSKLSELIEKQKLGNQISEQTKQAIQRGS